MLLDVKRFGRLARDLLARDDVDESLTYREFLADAKFSEYFIAHYAIPVVSCVWSSGHEDALGYPARYLFTFLEHHGFLSVKGSPQWFTVKGGSQTYVQAAADAIGDVRVSSPVTSVLREDDTVHITLADGTSEMFDAVVVATHPAQALAILDDATPDEKRVLGAFEYTPNQVTLHSDDRHLPNAPLARSAWNYRVSGCDPRTSTSSVNVSSRTPSRSAAACMRTTSRTVAVLVATRCAAAYRSWTAASWLPSDGVITSGSTT
jgi:predicted NAD/FAD-binding protein